MRSLRERANASRSLGWSLQSCGLTCEMGSGRRISFANDETIHVAPSKEMFALASTGRVALLREGVVMLRLPTALLSRSGVPTSGGQAVPGCPSQSLHPPFARLHRVSVRRGTDGLDGDARHRSRHAECASGMIPQSPRRSLQFVLSARRWLSWQDAVRLRGRQTLRSRSVDRQHGLFSLRESAANRRDPLQPRA